MYNNEIASCSPSLPIKIMKVFFPKKKVIFIIPANNKLEHSTISISDISSLP